jgi:4-hydroxy-4-methyl-2-oxoglutarate aldolase
MRNVFPHARLLSTCLLLILATSAGTAAQLIQFSKQDLIDYTAENPFGRLPDGRPKVPDDLVARARDLSSEEVWAVLEAKGYNNQYADGFQVLHPGKMLVGRAFTVQFMPVREDVHDVAVAKAKAKGIPRLMNQTAIDMLQPGDVLVVDLFGKKVNGTIVGDNLFFYIRQATKDGGLVVDGSVRDLNGLSEIDMPAYFRAVDPTPIGNVMLTGINVPVRIGDVTVMPGDLLLATVRVCTSFRRSLWQKFLIKPTRPTFMMSGPRKNLRKASTSPAKYTARPVTRNSSRNMRTI